MVLRREMGVAGCGCCGVFASACYAPDYVVEASHCGVGYFFREVGVG